ncbi:MAG: restriction endonuclease subunit S [Winogradskyella sp.]
MRRYETYKDSGVEWLGEIPKHWKYSSLKWYSQIYSGGTPSKDVDEFWIDGTIPWLNSGTVNQIDIIKASDYITIEAFEKSSAKWIPNKSLIIALAGQGKTKGMVAQVHFETTCNQSLGVIVPNEKIFNRFLFYWLKNNYQNIRNLGGGDKRDGLNLVMIGGIPIPLPNKEEQVQISNYLDEKTSQINELIAKKEQLILLLEEERTAIINQAVTKGLNPDAPLKDSGIDWLGEIPKDWKVMKGKYLFEIVSGYSPENVEDYIREEGISYFKVSDLNDKSSFFNLTKSNLYINNKIFKTAPKGTILFPKRGAAISTNKVKISTDECVFDTNIMGLIPNSDKIESRFLAYSILNRGLWDIADTSTIPQINNKHIYPLEFPFPKSIEIQKEIVAQLDSEIIKNNKTIKLIKKEINFLLEYKITLISDVVTGKIDVR